MSELYCFCLFLPSAVCLIALVTIARKLRKISADRLLVAAAALMTLYFFSYAYTDIQIIDYAGKVLGIAILPIIYLWARRILQQEDNPSDGEKSLWFLVQNYRNREWSARDKFMIRTDIAIITGVIVDIVRQLVDNGLLSEYIIGSKVVMCVLALIQAAAIYLFFCSAIYIGIIDNPAVNKDTYRAVQQARQRKLRDDFERLMTEEKPFLKQGLTIEDVALMLATNRTYVSSMLHDDYGSTFPEYMTEQRLEYSKQYMLDHPHEVQEEIAFQCGFASASGFNKRFREQYGITPKEWLNTKKRAS